VILPAYNAERYLPETLGSIGAQTYGDWEVIVSDDASTDATPDLVADFGSRFKVVRGSMNAGPAAARNRAIEASTGELLAFLDADDLWLPDYLERQVTLYDVASAIRADVGIVACDARILGPAGYRAKTYMEDVDFPERVTLARLLVSNPIFVSAVSPRIVVQEVGCFAHELFGTEDYDLWLRIVERGYRVVANRRPLAIYRLSPDSISTRHDEGTAALELTYRRALARGRLTRRQRWIAQRNIRLIRALREMTLIRQEYRDGDLRLGRVAHALPLLLVAKLEHPNHWFDPLRRAFGQATPTAALDRSDI
jgi:teichuronic acid biosynthesis glycosyltransferase TuaG